MNMTKEKAILIVDDEIEQLRTLHLGLRSRGYTALKALGVKEALRILAADGKEIDMILTDYAMPEMDGMQFLKKIRSEGWDLAVILMTAFGRKEVLVDAMRNHCNGFIEKPFDIEALISEIERVRYNRMRTVDEKNLSEIVPFLLHQINNPLGLIMASAEIGLRETDKTQRIEKRLQRILDGAYSIQRINNEVLNLSRGMEEARESVDITKLITVSLDELTDLSHLKSVRIDADVHEGCYVHGNRFGLEQVFRNLFTNAIDAMSNTAEKILKVSTAMDIDHAMVHIRVADTGCGISEEVLDRISQPYFTTKGHGTGLGLAVVERIVKKHKGSIKIQSKPGDGTTFTISIPMCQARSSARTCRKAGGEQ